jgi:hypothetical protein
VSFMQKLREAREEATVPRGDPWILPLGRLRGKLGDDGVERLSTQAIFDILEIPQRSRGAGACRRLSGLLVGLGWAPIRLRDFSRGGYLEQVRGYCRDAGHRSTAPGRDHAPLGGAPV